MRPVWKPSLKAFCSVLLCIAIVLVGPYKAVGERSSGRVEDGSAGASVLLESRDIKGVEAPSGPGSTAQARSLRREEGDGTKQRVETILRQIHADQIEDEDEPLIGKEDLQPNIGIPLVFNDAVDHYIRYFTTSKKELFKRWLKRKRRYAPLVQQILREHGLPEDLVYLAMIESGFNLLAYSPMKAAGPWQFIPETGKRYGLTVNHWVDERRDIRKSTIAAARYLQELFDQFGCWYLAAAGYNAGENRIDRLIKRHDTKDFWELRAYNTLPRETREYVPQLIAASIIAKDPAKFGFGDIEYVPPFEFVGESVPGGVPLEIVAEAASIDLPLVKTYNPEIRRGITPPGNACGIKLPAGTDSLIFQTSLSALLEEGKRVVGVMQHTVKRQDNVSKITKRYRVSKEDLVLVNGSPLSLKKGHPVYIPRFERPQQEEEPESERTADLESEPLQDTPAVKASSPKARYHVVRKGETLSSIAAKHGMNVWTLKRINRLKTNRVKWGTRLSITSVATLPTHERNARTIRNPRSKNEGPVATVSKPIPKTVKRYHTVRKGETLSGIATKYRKNVRFLKEINNLKGNHVRQGMRLRISSKDTGALPLFA
jgi:membrane-bound lytic murein transglycosylase D